VDWTVSSPASPQASRAARSSSSRACATNRATGTTTRSWPSNVLNPIVEYTSIPAYNEEVVISAGSSELLSFSFVFMTGHKLVRFSSAERQTLRPQLLHIHRRATADLA
jgi:hypothetical protein